MPTCEGKRAYKRRSDARRVMHRSATPQKAGVRAEIYKCPLCGHYHIGHDFNKRGDK